MKCVILYDICDFFYRFIDLHLMKRIQRHFIDHESAQNIQSVNIIEPELKLKLNHISRKSYY